MTWLIEIKDFPRRTVLNNVLRNKAFDTNKTSKYGGYQQGLASIVYILFKESFLVMVLKVKLCGTKD